MRALALSILVLSLAVPAAAQAPERPVRVRVVHERGPIDAPTLRRAWRPARFVHCADETPDPVIHLHVRVDPDGSVVIEHGLADDIVPPSMRCVVDALTSVRFSPQTEATHAHVTIRLWHGARPHS